jgi:CRP-like cAMP-binding protein
LGRITLAEATALIQLGTMHTVGPGTRLLRYGEPGTDVVLLLDGFVKITVGTADGREALLAVRVPGDMVGEMAALNNRTRSASVTTCGRCRYSVVQQDRLQSYLRQHPDAFLQLTAMMADRLDWANRRRVEFTAYPVHVRLARILCEMAVTYGRRVADGVEIRLRLTQPELATLCGAAEVTVQRALRELRACGLVTTGYRRTLVRDEARLRALADLDPPRR